MPLVPSTGTTRNNGIKVSAAGDIGLASPDMTLLSLFHQGDSGWSLSYAWSGLWFMGLDFDSEGAIVAAVGPASPLGLPDQIVRLVPGSDAVQVQSQGGLLSTPMSIAVCKIDPVPDDTTAPVITAAADPSILWPSNGKTVSVTVSGEITDMGSGLDLSSASYAILDEYGQVQPQGPIAVQTSGSYEFTVLLEAQRNGNDKDGRHYTISIRASDTAGNTGLTESVVTVPHDRR
jgi:hypothetical protein